jgi:aldehyde:ferredoxin oxidoreductase
MTYGWVGKILKVDLSNNDISTIDTLKYIPDYIGGLGISIRIAWDMLKEGVGPYDPDNIMIFMTGPLTGTLAPTSGRGVISSVSPRVYPNPWFTRSGIGGFWAPELKYAGYDGLIITGKASSPAYLWIHNNNVLIKDAEDLWGKGTMETQRMIKDIHGEDAQVLCIGPAGENLVRSATIQHNIANASGQAGFGAVMGSKNLKAIAIRGTGEIKIAEPMEFIKICKHVEEQVRNGPNFSGMANPGVPTPRSVSCSSGCPVHCIWCNSWKKMPSQIGPGSVTTIVHCLDFRFSWEFTEYNRPEVPDIKTKAIYGFGGGVDFHYFMKDLGLNEWDYMNLYQWLENFKQIGVEEIKGFKLDIDSPVFWFNFAKMIANREGIGDVFAENVIRASERLADLGIPEKYWDKLKRVANFLQPAYGFADHRTGRAFESQPTPLWIFSMLHWAFDNRDPMNNHHASSFVQYIWSPHKGVEKPLADVPFEKIKQVYQRIFGCGDVIAPGFEPVEEKVKAAIWYQHRSCMIESLLVCDWIFPRIVKSFNSQEELDKADDLTGDIDMESKLFSAATGTKMSTKDLEKCGERIYNLDRALHIKNYKRNRKVDETIGWVFELPEKTDGSRLNKEIFNRFVDTYYELRGWNKTNGYPTREKLEELGLVEMANVLYKEKNPK